MTKFQQMENDGEQIKRFVFGSKSRNGASYVGEKLEILIPELPLPGYSFYTWPSAPVLAWFLWERRHSLINKRVLEIGAGTALPGLLAAKCGAHVTLSDCSTLPKTLEHIQRCCRLNNLVPGPGKDIEVIGLTWGLFLDQVLQLGPLDLILGSDVFYDPSVFEDILVTVSFILEANPGAKFICTYQERSADWCIENLLKKWDLVCSVISLDNLSEDLGVDPQELMGNHTVHLLEIVRKPIG
ncbi:histone-arginine methyltransferase METTL23 [Anopheles moucheti]|uniref:histone-arginine methyltransferase METTL23 n=1 Tax=Anopheles moucheti TaxID=186751 RepID=UPI0022F00EA0|nr:histone-arginine methyltransferase METTL23 [Anopheles moucheti]XP_053659192.1 histone-arginine methyltransferase METTL23 [Anopheles marshallii]